MTKVQVSKVRYIELVNRAMQQQPAYQPGMEIKAVAPDTDWRGFVEVSGLPEAQEVLSQAIADVDREYQYME